MYVIKFYKVLGFGIAAYVYKCGARVKERATYIVVNREKGRVYILGHVFLTCADYNLEKKEPTLLKRE